MSLEQRTVYMREWLIVVIGMAGLDSRELPVSPGTPYTSCYNLTKMFHIQELLK